MSKIRQMLYVILLNGELKELPRAMSAAMEMRLVCRDERGRVVVSYDPGEVIMYGSQDRIKAFAQGQQRRNA
jgi:hypothetical protein